MRAMEKTQSEVEYPVRLASEADVIKILKDSSMRRVIFPDNTCVINFEPFDAVPENAFMMLRPYNWAFVRVNKAGYYDSISIMTTEIDTPAGCMFNIDYYGSNSSIIAVQHVMKHFQKLTSAYTNGLISVRMTAPDGIKYQDLYNDSAFIKLKQGSFSEKMYILQQPIQHQPVPKL